MLTLSSGILCDDQCCSPSVPEPSPPSPSVFAFSCAACSTLPEILTVSFTLKRVSAGPPLVCKTDLITWPLCTGTVETSDHTMELTYDNDPTNPRWISDCFTFASPSNCSGKWVAECNFCTTPSGPAETVVLGFQNLGRIGNPVPCEPSSQPNAMGCGGVLGSGPGVPLTLSCNPLLATYSDYNNRDCECYDFCDITLSE